MEGDFQVGDWLVRPDLNRFEREGEEKSIEPKAMDVLVYLTDHVREVLPKDRIIKAIWPGTFVTDDVLAHAISELRRAFGDDSRNPTFIETIPRRGYRLIAPVVDEARVAETRYQMLEEIGRGAMGEVFVADDTVLRRKVALKLVHEEMEREEKAKRRLLHEARAAAALDHPYICKIYDVGEMGGRTFIAMEYLEGETLKERLSQGPFGLKEVLRIAAEIAEALEAAHGKGIVHRDIKPSNIVLTDQGHIKVADFGIAKRLVRTGEAEQDWTGTISEDTATLGTLSYMSPEQLQGEEVDTRSDIFSFGIVLYELLVGEHPFRRPTQMETAGAILNHDPTFPAASQAGAGMALHETLRSMLAKDPNQRYQTIEEVRRALEHLLEMAAPLPWTRRWPYWAAALLAVVALAVALVYFLSVPAPIPTVTNLTRLNLDGQRKFLDAIATDGRQVYYSQSDDIGTPDNAHIRHISVKGGAAVPIDLWPQEERVTLPWDFSPDHSRLLVTSGTPDDLFVLYDKGLPLWILSLPARAQPLGGVRANRALWSPDGESIAYSSGNDLYVGPSDGSDFKKILTAQNWLWVYSWSPSGRQLAYGVYYFAADRCELWKVNSDGTEPQQLLTDQQGFERVTAAKWTPNGKWLLFKAGREESDLWALRGRTGLFERNNPEPIRLTESAERFHSFALSPDGKRIYAICSLPRTELVHYREEIDSWVPYGFKPTASPGGHLDFSSDGQWVTYVETPNPTLWRSRVDGTQKRQLTEPGLYIKFPRWSRDNKKIAFTAGPNPWGIDYRIYVISSEGGPMERVIGDDYTQENADWSPDGRLLVSGKRRASQPLVLVDLETGEIEELPDSEGKWQCAWSPDGRYIAAHEADSRDFTVFYVQEGNWRPLKGCRGVRPTWSADSRNLYFARSPSMICRVRIEDEHLEEVADMSEVKPRFVDRWWWGLGPEGALLMTRQLETPEIHALDLEEP
jgi:serine/threonine protein kinase/Tol biopolymer transport system component